MHAAPFWLPMTVYVATAAALWFAIFKPTRRLSLWSLLVLLSMLAAAFALVRWQPRGTIDIVSESRAVAE